VKVFLVITKGETGGAQTDVLVRGKALSAQVQFAATIGGTQPVSA